MAQHDTITTREDANSKFTSALRPVAVVRRAAGQVISITTAATLYTWSSTSALVQNNVTVTEATGVTEVFLAGLALLSLSCDLAGTSGQIITVGITKNGTLVAQSSITLDASTNTQFGLHHIELLASGDDISFAVTSNASSTTVTITNTTLTLSYL